MTLAEFLEARIAEDEAVARAVRPDEYLPTRDSVDLADSAEGAYRWITVKSGRVLAECLARRQILEIHRSMTSPYTEFPHCSMCVNDTGWPATSFDPLLGNRFPCTTLRALALPYSTHPDFDPSWLVGDTP
jgi:hypothetical protein